STRGLRCCRRSPAAESRATVPRPRRCAASQAASPGLRRRASVCPGLPGPAPVAGARRTGRPGPRREAGPAARDVEARRPWWPSPGTSPRGCVPGPSGGIPARAGSSARAGRLLPTPSPRRACGPCGSGPAPREGAPRTGLRRLGWPLGSPLAALQRAPQGLQHAFEALERSGQRLALALRELEAGHRQRRLRALQRLLSEAVLGGPRESRPERLEFPEQLFRAGLAVLEFGILFLPEHPVLVRSRGLLDLILGETRRGGDGDALPRSRLHVDGGDGNDAVGADVEDDV